MGDLERGVPSIVSIDLSELAEHPTYAITPHVLHEGMPGHHLQVASTAENEELSVFRRGVWFTAYGEGWALYAERLGFEMGLYSDCYSHFGLLHSEMRRACRLALDPAIHALDWSKERASEFLRENTLLSDAVIDQDVNRYIAWPAQAVAYKLGELKLTELRTRAEREFGASFDIRHFHAVILRNGALPLAVLERNVNAWIDAHRTSAAQD